MKKIQLSILLVTALAIKAASGSPAVNPLIAGNNTATNAPKKSTAEEQKQKTDEIMDGAKMTAEERRALWNQTVSIDPPDVDTSYYERLFAPLDKKEKALPRPDKSASSAKPKEPKKSFAENHPKWNTLLKYGVFPFGAPAAAIALGFASLGPLGIATIGLGGYYAYDKVLPILGQIDWSWKLMGLGLVMAMGAGAGVGLAYYGGFSLMYKIAFGLAGAVLGFLGIQSLMPTEKQN